MTVSEHVKDMLQLDQNSEIVFTKRSDSESGGVLLQSWYKKNIT